MLLYSPPLFEFFVLTFLFCVSFTLTSSPSPTVQGSSFTPSNSIPAVSLLVRGNSLNFINTTSSTITRDFTIVPLLQGNSSSLNHSKGSGKGHDPNSNNTSLHSRPKTSGNYHPLLTPKRGGGSNSSTSSTQSPSSFSTSIEPRSYFSTYSSSSPATTISSSQSTDFEASPSPSPTETPTADDDETGSGRLEWGDIRANTIAGQGPSSPMTEVLWTVPLFHDILKAGIPLLLSPKFYVSVPGPRIQLILIPNSTYSDDTSHLGIFFRLVTGEFDADIEWPYQYVTTAAILKADGQESPHKWSVIPNRDPCRLRSAFLRQSTDNDNDPRPDGCGSRRVIDLSLLTGTEGDKDSKGSYVRDDGSIVIVSRVFINDTGKPYDSAFISVKYNDFISEYVWSIKGFKNIQQESYRQNAVAVLSSEPFYTHPSGYLIQMFLTLLPGKNAFAVSTAFLQGDFDRSLDWPFPYPFEVALIDQSPSYWKRDYSVNLDSSSADCGSAPFMQPSFTGVEFCFITVQSMELLSLTHYNFLKDDTLKIRFQTKVLPLTRKPTAALTIRDRHLVAEYSWIIPDIENKLERFDYSGRKVKIFTSEKFYTTSQGYLMQMMLQLNHTDRKNGSMGLELSILEGEYDSILSWPFSHKFELMIINQRPPGDGDSFNGSHSSSSSQPSHHPISSSMTDSSTEDPGDIIVGIDPSVSSCDHRSFTRPIERNPPCGRKNVISFARVQRSSSGFVRLGSLLVKVRIYLAPL